MRALLLAAGFGTRLRPLTDTVPKCLVPIHGRPLLDYWFDLLFASDAVERVLVNTHYKAEAVRAHVASSPYRERIDLIHENELLGTGGTVAANAASFAGRPFLLAHADNLTNFDLPDFQAAHAARPRETVMTMLAFRTDDPRSCGILELDPRNVVQAFHEKVDNPPGNLANAAVYVIGPEMVEATRAIGRATIDLQTEVLPQFMGRIFAVETDGYHRDIGTPASLRQAEAEFGGATGSSA